MLIDLPDLTFVFGLKMRCWKKVARCWVIVVFGLKMGGARKCGGIFGVFLWFVSCCYSWGYGDFGFWK